MVGTSCVFTLPLRESSLLTLNMRIGSGAPTITSLQYPWVCLTSCMCIWHLAIILITTYRLALLYYDYTLTFEREYRLFWSRRNIKQWGYILFFLNRYCGILGHVPVIVEMFPLPKSSLYSICKPVNSYHQVLAVMMQTIIGCTSLSTTILPPRGLSSPPNSDLHHEDLCLVSQKPRGARWVDILGSRFYRRLWGELWPLKIRLPPHTEPAQFLMTQGEKLAMNPVLPEGSVGCSAGLSWSQ
jgi:hypothetical protein